MIKEVFDKLLLAVYPKRCELCAEVVALDEELCEECSKLKRVEGELCRICGHPKSQCACSKNEKAPEYKSFIAPYFYEGSITAGVLRFKDYGYPELAKRFGEEISRHIEDYYNGIEFDCITYVPITNKKLRKRGYNQSQLLAKEVSEQLDIPCREIIEKIKETSQQKRSNAKQRKVNLRGSFDLKQGESVAGLSVLLIDDVKTTGSTLNECSYVMNAYGAKAVYAAALCMTQNKDLQKEK